MEERQSFVFYLSFLEAIEEFDKDTQLKMYQAIANYALRNIILEDMNAIERGIFKLIKPQIDANFKRYEDGKKGGRPKKIKTSGYKNNEIEKTSGFNKSEKIKTSGYENKNQWLLNSKPVVIESNEIEKPNVNDNVNVNDNDEVLENQKNKNQEETKEIKTTTLKDVENFVNSFGKNVEPREKKKDPYIIPPIERKFKTEYQKVFNNVVFLTMAQKNRLVELNEEIENFGDTIPMVLQRLKKINFKDIGFKPMANWLLKDNNYTSVLNGEYENPEQTEKDRINNILDKIKEGAEK